MVHHTLNLRRLDRRSLEARANRFVLLVWALIWVLLAVLAKMFWDQWYGLAAGLIPALGVAVWLMWFFYIRQSARKKKLVVASWRDAVFRVFDPMANREDEVDLSQPHRAIFIQCKASNQFLLRIEEIRDNQDETPRINLIGALPLGNPMRVSGEAHSFMGFYKMATSGITNGIPYEVRSEDHGAAESTLALLQFVERFKAQRDNTLVVSRNNDEIRVAEGVFSLTTPDKTVVFDERLPLVVDTMQMPFTSGGNALHEVRIALSPQDNREDALVFSLIVELCDPEQFAKQWDVPKSVMHRKFSLYDDSAQTYVVALALKKYLRRIDPNNPALSLLRH